MPEHLDWVILRPVLAQVATLEEIDRHYDILDLADINEALDLQAEAEYLAMKAAKGS